MSGSNLKVGLSLGLVAAAGLGCSFVVGSLAECDKDADCVGKAGGRALVCVEQLCVAKAGSGDAGTPVVDAGPADAGPTDAGPDVLRDDRCQLVFGTNAGADALHYGALLPMTRGDGSADQRGVLRGNAVQLVVDKINAGGGLLARKVTFRVCDTRSDPVRAGELARLMLAEGPLALVSAGSAETLAIAQVANPVGVVVVSGSASSTQIGAAGASNVDGGPKLVWSMAPSDDLQGSVLADLLVDGGPVQRDGGQVTVIHRDDVYGNGLWTRISTLMRQSGVNPVRVSFAANFNADGGTLNLPPAARTSPAAVVIASPTEAVAVLESWKATGDADPKWLFSDNARATSLVTGLTDGASRLAGSLGTVPSTPSAATSATYSDFDFQYRNAFSVDPAGAAFVANTYDATMVLMLGTVWAEAHGGLTGANVAAGLAMLADGTQSETPLLPDNLTQLSSQLRQGRAVNVEGASGALQFDPATGVPPGPIDVWTVLPDGGLATLRTVRP